MFDLSGSFSGYRGIGMDVTERMGPGQAHMRFRSAIDTIEKGICLVDRASMRVIDANETACRMSGYSRQELYSIDLADFGIGSSEQLAISFDALIAGGVAYKQTAELHCKDSSTLVASIDWSALEVSGSWIIVGVISPGTVTE